MSAEMDNAHYSNFGVSQCDYADNEGFVHFRADFESFPESDWTPAERWIAEQNERISEWRSDQSQRKRPGPKPLPDGMARTARIEIRTTTDRKAKAERIASAAGLSVAGWWERAVDKARE